MGRLRDNIKVNQKDVILLHCEFELEFFVLIAGFCEDVSKVIVSL